MAEYRGRGRASETDKGEAHGVDEHHEIGIGDMAEQAHADGARPVEQKSRCAERAETRGDERLGAAESLYHA